MKKLFTILFCLISIIGISQINISYWTKNSSGQLVPVPPNAGLLLTGNVVMTGTVTGGTPLTTEGDLLSHNGSNLVRVGANQTSTNLVLTSVLGGIPSWQPVPITGVSDYFLTSTASDIGTCKQQVISAPLTASTITATGISNGSLIACFVTNTGYPGLPYIEEGVIQVHINANQTAGTKTVTIYAQIWEVSSLGVDIQLIATTNNTTRVLTSTVTELSIYKEIALTPLASIDSRTETRLFATAGAGTDATINIQVGNGYHSHTSLPAPSVDITSFVPYTGATQNLDMSTHSITATKVSAAITSTAINFTDGYQLAGKVLGSSTAGVATWTLVGTQGIAPASITYSLLATNLTGSQVGVLTGTVLAINFSNGATTTFTATANFSISITNPVQNLCGTILVKQDATGSRLLNTGLPATSIVANGGAGSIVLSTTANALDVLTFLYLNGVFIWNYTKNAN